MNPNVIMGAQIGRAKMTPHKRKQKDVLGTPEIKNLFGTSVARAALDVEHVEFHVLLKRFHLAGSHSKGAGKSFRNLFTPFDLYRLKLALHMSRQGLRSGLISDVLDTIGNSDFVQYDQSGRVPATKVSLVLRQSTRKRWLNGDPRDVVWYDIELRQVNMAYYVCDLGVIVREVDRVLEDIRLAKEARKKKSRTHREKVLLGCTTRCAAGALIRCLTTSSGISSVLIGPVKTSGFG
jgi:hypothetical protein